MKMAVVLGITHMIFGLILKASNGIHWGARIELIFETIPQIIFMGGLFG
jgi:V-type H+-transporting ATPase subunit a